MDGHCYDYCYVIFGHKYLSLQDPLFVLKTFSQNDIFQNIYLIFKSISIVIQVEKYFSQLS
jgi:hypothetical protein